MPREDLLDSLDLDTVSLSFACMCQAELIFLNTQAEAENLNRPKMNDSAQTNIIRKSFVETHCFAGGNH